ncbi:MAG TPA: DUF4132 domain-containing protein [Candidatus Eremiobacteraceae bacterium]|nr:DUF4132 domain-containing protein [Candidatus Eremiobacteraceae bacterium]
MIAPDGAKELSILRNPRMLLTMTSDEQNAALDYLAATQHCPAHAYYAVHHGKAKEYVLESTMLSLQVETLRAAFAEWPSLLIEVLALSLEARTGTPTTRWLGLWGNIADQEAVRRARPALVRLAAEADTRDENMSAYVAKTKANRDGLPPPANAAVWEAARCIKRACIWMLSRQPDSEIRDLLEKLSEPAVFNDGPQNSAALWALARSADTDAVERLRRMLKRPLFGHRRKLLREYISSIELALGNAGSEDPQAIPRLRKLAGSGYVVAESIANAFSGLASRPQDQRTLCDLLSGAEGPRPSKRWEANWRRLRGETLDPQIRQTLLGVVRAYNEITLVKPVLSTAEYEAQAYFYKTGAEQPGNPAARDIAKRERERKRLHGIGTANGSEINDCIENMARGAHWALAGCDDEETCDLWGNTVIAWAKMGDPNPAAASAAIHAMGSAPSERILIRLQELRARVTHKNLAKRIESAFEAVARNQGISADELADRLVPTHGLDEGGLKMWAIGDWSISLLLADDGGVRTVFRNSTGKVVRSLPRALARANGDAVLEVRTERKRLASTVSLQRARFERAMVDRRTWSAESWRRNVMRHPVLANLARRLVWKIDHGATTVGTGLPDSEETVAAVDGVSLKVGADNALTLVHPVELSYDVQSDWQHRIVHLKVVQPFKQIFRETYYPTSAERDESSLIRYRGHIVPLQVLRALTSARGWSGGLGLAGFDGSGLGSRRFAAFGAEASLSHDGPTDEASGRLEILEFHRLVSHEVKTVTGRLGPKMRLGDVPPVVFSEAVRDIDLVASVGSVGVGELGITSLTEPLATAFGITRAPAIAALMPSLGLKDRVDIAGCYAIVDGRFRIHLGTGVIAHGPSGQAVKIKLGNRIARDIRLPFEDRDDAITILLNLIIELSHHG